MHTLSRYGYRSLRDTVRWYVSPKCKRYNNCLLKVYIGVKKRKGDIYNNFIELYQEMLRNSTGNFMVTIADVI